MNQISHWLAAAAMTVGLLGQAIIAPVQAGPRVAAAVRQEREAKVERMVERLARSPQRVIEREPAPQGTRLAETLAYSPVPLPAEREATTAVKPLQVVQASDAAPEPAATAPDSAPATSPETATAPQPKGKLIFIDAGHGGDDTGSVHTGADGQIDLKEEDVNLDIALRLADMLRQQGYDVQMDRTGDTTPVPGDASKARDLQARVDMANDSGADLLISVHSNALENKDARGTEVWYCSDRPFSDQDHRLANSVQEALVRNLRQAGYDTVDRGIKDESSMGHFAVLGPHIARPSKMPGIIGEALYMTNDQDAAQMQRPEVRDAIARGYCEGIQAYFDGQA